MHLTILESFRGLFDDLQENLKQHIDTFESGVDGGDSVFIKSKDLEEIKEDMKEVFEKLEEQDENIHETIEDVTDISAATPPSFSDIDEWKGKATKKLKELDEDLASFTGESDETDVKAIMEEIEAAMDNAKASEGKARFSDSEGASEMKELEKLQDYNEDKKEEQLEKAKEARDNVLQDENKPSSRDVVNKAYEEYKNGDIKYDQYTDILDSVKNTNENMSEDELKDNATDGFIEYLKDRDMLEDYLEDHETVAKYVVKSMPSMLASYVKGATPRFLENLGYRQKDLAKELMKTEKGTNLLNKTDPKLTREILNTLETESEFFKYAKYTKYGMKALGGLAAGYTFYDDVKNNDKTKGEAAAHTGTALAIGSGVAALTPAGWAVGAGIVASAGFEYMYQNNVAGVQDGIDKAGEKLSEWGSDLKDAAGEALKNPVIASINPFS